MIMLMLFVLAVGNLLNILGAVSLESENTCDIQLRFTGGAGIGVFAGKDWAPGEQLELVIGVPVPLTSVYWTKLINYSEGYNETHCLVATGFAMLYNHVLESDKAMVRKHMSNSPGIYHFRSNNSSYGYGERSNDIIFEPNSVIAKGEQILNFYGDDWFVDRDQQEVNINHIGGEIASIMHPLGSAQLPAASDTMSSPDMALFTTLPGCPSSMVKYQENRIFAGADIQDGEIIEVSRAILLPDWSFPGEGPLGELLWWGSAPSTLSSREYLSAQRQTVESQFPSPYNIVPYDGIGTRYAMLLTGYGSFYSPGNITMPDSPHNVISIREPNVRYEWWSSNRTAAVQCDLLMMVSFTAMGFIEEGEELVVDMLLDTATGMKRANFGQALTCLN